MMERDEELNKLLRQWEAPAPDPRLDRRVISALPKRRSRRWLPLAAGVLLAAGLAKLLLPPQVDAAAFRPLANGAITVEKAEGRQ